MRKAEYGCAHTWAFPPNWGRESAIRRASSEEYAKILARDMKIWLENGKIQAKFQNFFACGAYRHRRRYIILLFCPFLCFFHL